jgi:MFS family permease
MAGRRSSHAISGVSVRGRTAFVFLAVSNVFVGLLLGTERTLVPLLGVQVFGLGSAIAALSFIATFGVTKAVANLFSGAFRGPLRVRILAVGWALGVPVPLAIMYAPPGGWWIVLVANAFLGVNQGLCWSSTVMMMIDEMPPARRGLATGVNEFAGYGGVALAALGTGWLAGSFGLRPVPFLIGLGAAGIGLLFALVLVKGTSGPAASALPYTPLSFRIDRSLARFTWQKNSLRSLHVAGLVTNLKDGIVWGLVPLLLASRGLGIVGIGLVASVYPVTWGICQLGTGPLSDRVGRRGPIVLGMFLQATGLAILIAGSGLLEWLSAMTVIGLGTALVYPTLQAAIADRVPSIEKDEALAVYRFWRDSGFVAGALGGGFAADLAGIPAAVVATALVAIGAGLLVALGAHDPEATAKTAANESPILLSTAPDEHS